VIAYQVQLLSTSFGGQSYPCPSRGRQRPPGVEPFPVASYLYPPHLHCPTKSSFAICRRSLGITPSSITMYRPGNYICNMCRLLGRALPARTAGPKHRRPKSTSSTPSSEPIEDYYSLLLSQPLLQTVPTIRTSPSPRTPPPPDSKAANIAKARVVFGSRLAGPAERRREIDAKSSLIAGVLVPSRPQEPDNCCMSGCVNCVWDIYRDDLEEWAAKSREARMKEMQLKGAQESGSMDDDRGGSETNWSLDEGQDLFANVPVGIREFMRTEKILKERHLKEGTKRG